VGKKLINLETPVVPAPLRLDPADNTSSAIDPATGMRLDPAADIATLLAIDPVAALGMRPINPPKAVVVRNVDYFDGDGLLAPLEVRPKPLRHPYHKPC
jgi:hypothetical protein